MTKSYDDFVKEYADMKREALSKKDESLYQHAVGVLLGLNLARKAPYFDPSISSVSRQDSYKL